MKLIYDSSECSFEQEINEASGEKKYIIKGVFSTPGVKNKNGRIYPSHLWEREVGKYQDTIKSGSSNSLLELDHPPRTNVEMMEAVAKMRKLYMQDGKVMGEAVLLNNPKANQLKTLIDNGIKMSVSSRGLGSVVENTVKDYKLITFDIIPDQGQSDYNAEMMGITEGILTEKSFEIDESGRINEVQVCTKDACHIFEASDVQKATKEKFEALINEMKGSRANTGKKKVNESFDDLNEGSDQTKANEILKKELSKKYEISGGATNGFSIKIGNAVGRISFEEQYERDFKTTIEKVVDDLKSNNSFSKVELQKDGTIFVKFKNGNDARQFDNQPGLKSIFRIFNVKVDHAVNGLSGDEFYLVVKDK